jgi:hypothetical protein
VSWTQSRWLSFARYETRDVEAWKELVLQLGLRLPADFDELISARGLPHLAARTTTEGLVVTGSLTFLTPAELFSAWRTSSDVHVEVGAFSTPDDDEAGDDSGAATELLLDAQGRFGHRGRWSPSFAGLLEATDRRLASLGDVEIDEDEELSPPRPRDLAADVARKRASGKPWWSADWRPVFRGHRDVAVAREILAEIGNGHTQTRGGGSLVTVDDLVHRLPEPARRAWVVEELSTAAPPTPEVAVALDELSEASDGRALPREKLQRLVPLAWADRSPKPDVPTRWARALLLAMGRPTAEHLLHAVRLAHGGAETPAQWERALAHARSALVL